jgi:hypothetical protein
MDDEPKEWPGFRLADYALLNARQREVYNFHAIAALLARYGFATYPIRDDWNGGDMIARHMTESNRPIMTIQIKGRVTFDRKYIGKQLWIGFPLGADAIVYPHDEVLTEYTRVRAARNQALENSKAWSEDGTVHWAKPTEELMTLLERYRLSAILSGENRFVANFGDFEIMPADSPSDG